MIASAPSANNPRLRYSQFLSADSRSPHGMLGIQIWRGRVDRASWLLFHDLAAERFAADGVGRGSCRAGSGTHQVRLDAFASLGWTHPAQRCTLERAVGQLARLGKRDSPILQNIVSVLRGTSL